MLNVSKVGVTRVIPIKNTIYGAHRDFVLNGCVEIRERVLKNGTKILAGYKADSDLANFVQKINGKGIVEQEKFYSSEKYGHNNQKREVHLEKITYNKIGDKLKHYQLFKIFEKSSLMEKFEALMDIIKGIDKSEKNDFFKGIKVQKERIDNVQYRKEIHHQGILKSSTIEKDVDPEGLWRY